MTCCPSKEWGQYIVQGCAGGVRVDQIVSWKFLRPEERFFEYTSDYVTFTETRPVDWIPGQCPGETGYDFEIVTLTNDGGITKIPGVSRWEIINGLPIQKLYDKDGNDVTSTHELALDFEKEKYDLSPVSFYCVNGTETVSRIDIVDYSSGTPLVVGSIWQDISGVMIANPPIGTYVAGKCELNKRLVSALPGCLITSGGAQQSMDGFDFDIDSHYPGNNTANTWLMEAQFPTGQVYPTGNPSDPGNILALTNQSGIQLFIDTYIINEHNNSFGQGLVAGDIIYMANADNTATLWVKPGTDLSWIFVFDNIFGNFGNDKFNATIPTTHTLTSGTIKIDVQIEKYDLNGVVTEEIWIADFSTNPATRTKYIPVVGDNIQYGYCSLIKLEYNKVVDGTILDSVVGGVATYTFSYPVSDIDITNLTNGIAMITYNNSIPTLGNNTSPIAPDQSVTFNAKDDSELITSVSIQDIDSTYIGKYLIKGVRL